MQVIEAVVNYEFIKSRICVLNTHQKGTGMRCPTGQPLERFCFRGPAAAEGQEQ